MTCCDIRNWIRVNNNALAYFGGVTPTVTSDNCKVAVQENRDWIAPYLNKDFQAWAEHNDTVLTPAKIKAPKCYQRKSVIGNLSPKPDTYGRVQAE